MSSRAQRGAVQGWVAAAVLLGAASPVAAHLPVPRRDLVVQVDDRGVVALWSMSIAGPAAELLRRVHDRNADGRLSGSEASAVALMLVSKAASGVEILWDGVKLVPGKVEARLATTTPRLTAVGLVTLTDATGASRSPAEAAARGVSPTERRLTVKIPTGTGALRVRAQALGVWQLEEETVILLAPGEQVDLWLERAEKAGGG